MVRLLRVEVGFKSSPRRSGGEGDAARLAQEHEASAALAQSETRSPNHGRGRELMAATDQARQNVARALAAILQAKNPDYRVTITEGGPGGKVLLGPPLRCSPTEEGEES